MATRPPKAPAPPLDPSTAANQQILADREARILSQAPEPIDLGIELKEEEPATVQEYIDEWDRKAFGDPVPAIKKIVYGPDPLIDQCPEMKARIEKYGLHDWAQMTREAILEKGETAFPDALMRRGARLAIAKFGAEKFAQAMVDRLLRIPMREVEIDASDTVDPLIMGGSILRETVKRFGRPGMAVKFQSQRGIELFGLRGYEIVKDPDTGQPVKAGTLIMTEIPQHIAEQRRQYYASESDAEVREIEEAYREMTRRQAKGTDAAPLAPDEMVSVTASESEGLLGQSRRAGMRIERQERMDRRQG